MKAVLIVFFSLLLLTAAPARAAEPTSPVAYFSVFEPASPVSAQVRQFVAALDGLYFLISTRSGPDYILRTNHRGAMKTVITAGGVRAFDVTDSGKIVVMTDRGLYSISRNASQPWVVGWRAIGEDFCMLDETTPAILSGGGTIRVGLGGDSVGVASPGLRMARIPGGLALVDGISANLFLFTTTPSRTSITVQVHLSAVPPRRLPRPEVSSPLIPKLDLALRKLVSVNTPEVAHARKRRGLSGGLGDPKLLDCVASSPSGDLYLGVTRHMPSVGLPVVRLDRHGRVRDRLRLVLLKTPGEPQYLSPSAIGVSGGELYVVDGNRGVVAVYASRGVCPY